MLIMNSEVVIRYCLDRAFLIHVHKNKIITLKKEAIQYLLYVIECGSVNDCALKNQNFEKMVEFLVSEGFLEVRSDEI